MPNQLIVQMHVRSFQISSDLAEGDVLGIVISLMILCLQVQFIHKNCPYPKIWSNSVSGNRSALLYHNRASAALLLLSSGA